MVRRSRGLVHLFFLAVIAAATTSCSLVWIAGRSGARTLRALPRESALAAAPTEGSSTVSAQTADVPVGGDDFPDPYVLVTTAGFYAYSTNSRGLNVPVKFSTDLLHWTSVGDAAPELPDWMVSDGSMTWAPSVTFVDGFYVLYVSVAVAGTDRHCIAVGTSSSAGGPFQFRDQPLVCGERGAIDASPFIDSNGRRWLLWKAEASGTQPTRILSQRLTADGQSLTGPVSTLVSATRAWEQGTVEGPSMAQVGDDYYLFYAGGDWTNDSYATAYARCTSPEGPCVDSDAPFISTSGGVSGPGGLEVFVFDGQLYGALHSWADGVGYPSGHRVLQIRRLTLSNSVATWGP